MTEIYPYVIGALLLVLVLRPPTVVIQQRDNGYGSSGLGWFVGFVFIVGFFWLLNRSGCSARSNPGAEGNLRRANTQTLINQPPRSSGLANTNLRVNAAPKDLPENNSVREDEGFSVQEEDLPEMEPVWVLLLKHCQNVQDVDLLALHFPTRSIQAVEMTNGEFWAVIYAPSNLKKEAETEKKDWLRHIKDWERLGIEPKIIDLNNL